MTIAGEPSGGPASPGAVEQITPNRIVAVAERIAPFVRRTPVIRIDAREFGLPSADLRLKLELMQHAGSFKTRGAFANLLLREVPAAGIAAASGGNHGAAVAYAAMTLGKPARIFVPRISSPAKVERIRRYGADLVVVGADYGDALAASEEWIAESGAMRIHAFDQVETLLGQGTLGMEIESQLPDLDTLLLAVGGGGLIGGVAAWYTGRIKVVGVEPRESPTMTRALQAGHPVDAEVGGIAADSLGPRRVGRLNFELARRFVSQVVLVSDRDIRAAQEALWSRLSIVAEPGGAAAFAALLSGAYVPAPGERVCALISGGNSAAVEFTR